MLDISIIILQKNERLHIRRCLENLRGLGPRQIFVVDCYSTDGSDEIARAMGAVVVQHEWPGLHSAQMNWALTHLPIVSDWVMRLDADEYFLPEAIEEIKEKLPRLSKEITGVISKRRTYFYGGWAKHGTYPVKLLRIFRKGKAICEERNMDEHMQLIEGRAVEFDEDFVDCNLSSFECWKEKHRSYAKKEARDAVEIIRELREGCKVLIKIDGQAAEKRALKYRYYKFPPYFRAFAYFCIRYFLKGGFLDGIVGWRWNFWQGLWYRLLVDREISRLRRMSICII